MTLLKLRFMLLMTKMALDFYHTRNFNEHKKQERMRSLFDLHADIEDAIVREEKEKQT